METKETYDTLLPPEPGNPAIVQPEISEEMKQKILASVNETQKILEAGTKLDNAITVKLGEPQVKDYWNRVNEVLMVAVSQQLKGNPVDFVSGFGWAYPNLLMQFRLLAQLHWLKENGLLNL